MCRFSLYLNPYVEFSDLFIGFVHIGHEAGKQYRHKVKLLTLAG